MKRFIATVKRNPAATAAVVADDTDRENQRFKELFEAGIIWDYYKQLDAPNFWLIVHSPSLADARAQLSTFPYFEKGFITIEIEELEVQNKFTR